MSTIVRLIDNYLLYYLKKSFHCFHELVRRALIHFLDVYGGRDIEFDDVGDWVLDSASAFHAVKDKHLLRNISSCKAQALGFSGQSEAGDARLPIFGPSSNEYITLRGVLYLESLNKNLISVSKLTADFPYSVEFDDAGFVVENCDTKKIVARGLQFRKMYYWRGIRLTFGRLMKGFCNMLSLKKWIRPSDDGIDHEKARDFFLDHEDEDEDEDLWVLDSGAPVHLGNIEVELERLCPYKEEYKYSHSDIRGRELDITHMGTAFLGPLDNGVILHPVELGQSREDNRISIAALTSDNCCSVKFYANGFLLTCVDMDMVIARGMKSEKDNLYHLSNSCFTEESIAGTGTGTATRRLKRRSRNKKRTGKSWNSN